MIQIFPASSRKGNCCDNACIELFYELATVKTRDKTSSFVSRFSFYCSKLYRLLKLNPSYPSLSLLS